MMDVDLMYVQVRQRLTRSSGLCTAPMDVPWVHVGEPRCMVKLYVGLLF